VLSFLVTLFFTRVKKRVTRSSEGGVEALALGNKERKELDSRLRGNDEDESYPFLRRRSGSSGSWKQRKERTGFPPARE
jgi:hypothetical protein